MYGEREDSDARKNALGAVQKLSLRRSLARMMIKDNIVQWVVDNLLTQQDTLSDYTLRYSLALLMNISLRSIGEKLLPCNIIVRFGNFCQLFPLLPDNYFSFVI